MTLNRPRWKLYRHCYDCGVDKAVACRDDMDRISDVVCAGRRLMSEPPEVIVDDVVPAAPVKVRKLARAEFPKVEAQVRVGGIQDTVPSLVMRLAEPGRKLEKVRNCSPFVV